MNKTNLLLSALILSAVFLLGCSSDGTCSCKEGDGSSSSSSGGGGDLLLTKKSITISSEKSYADIDGENPEAYEKDDAKNNATKIDLVAYCGTDNGYCKNSNSIYRPYEIDLFMNPGFIGSHIFLFEIPPEKSDVFRTATRYSDIYQTLISLNLSGSGEKEIPIEKDKVFIVVSSEDEWYYVIIKAIGNQSVDLEVVLIPTSK